ncbi:MAG: M28 family peptidase [Bacteroidia bacterium]|nr:M28 family peptidase [Bacteroidia bacterium]MDW8158661.1 M28 family peptidase [Bacteroidia bacterium]
MQRILGFIYSSLLSYFCINYPEATAQNLTDSLEALQKARWYIQILSHDSLAGRGYHKGGHIRAAQFIAQEFQKIGLKPYFDSYFQYFTIQINLIQSAKLKVDKKPLEAGKDFIVAATAPSIQGKFRLTYLDYHSPHKWKKNFNSQFIAIKEEAFKGTKSYPDAISLAQAKKAKGIILLKKKLTHTFSKQIEKLPIVEIATQDTLLLQKASKVQIQIQSQLATIQTQNVVGYVPGTLYADSLIVFCAHYDHLGMLENAIFYGANDNASGVAFLLELARKVTHRPLKYSALFIAFGAEETGLEGSFFFTQNVSPELLRKIKFVLNFDLLGNGEEGIMAVGGTNYPQLFNLFKEKHGFLKHTYPLKLRSNAPNSDHYPFTLQGIPALFFYTLGGAPHYHDIYDRASAINLPIFYNFQKLVLAVLNSL